MHKKVLMVAVGLAFTVGISTSAFAATNSTQVSQQNQSTTTSHGKHENHFVSNPEIQKLLGMTKAQIEAALQSGKTKGQLLDEKGITHVQFQNAMKNHWKKDAHFAQNPEIQKLLGMSQAQIEQVIQGGKTFAQLLDEKKITFVQLEKAFPHKMHKENYFAQNPEIQKLLGMSQAQIEQAMKDGKTMAQLLDEKGITHVQFQNAMKSQWKKGAHFAQNPEIQKLLGMTQVQIESALQSGKTFAQLLDEKKITFVQMEKIKKDKEHGREHPHQEHHMTS